MEDEHEKMMSLRGRRKKSSISITSCFSGGGHQRRASFDVASFSSSTPASHPSPRRSPAAWIRSKNFISRVGGRHRRHSSADFSYDPLSYALNFDDDASTLDDDFRSMSFSARLPVSSPKKRTSTLFDQNLPKTSPPSSSEVSAERRKREEAMHKIEAANDDLRRGFERLSVSMKEPHAGGQMRRNKTAAVAAEVRKSQQLEADDQEHLLLDRKRIVVSRHLLPAWRARCTYLL